MRWKELHEMPVGRLDLMGVKPNGSFRHDTDRNIMGSDKGQAKIKRLLARTPEIIDLVFMDTGQHITPENILQNAMETAGPKTYEDFRRLIPEFPERSNPNAIMLALTNNEGAERVQLSGWIVAHRMGHALAFGRDFENRFDNIVYAVEDLNSYWRDGWMIPKIELLYEIGQMKSCRDRRLSAADEIVFELFAQHIIGGAARFNRLTLQAGERMAARARERVDYVPAIRDSDIERFNEMLDGAERTINSSCRSILEAARSLVVVL